MYNNEFKIIDTEEKAYVLGQAFGDGCNQYLKKYKFCMASIIDDKSLYEQINNIFPFLRLHIYNASPNLIRLEATNKKLSLDLKELGLTQNKCEQDKLHNFNIPKIPTHLMHHFVRGLFDADGSVYTPTRYRSRNNIRVEFTFGAENFCRQLSNLLTSLNIVHRFDVVNKIVWNKPFIHYRIAITSRKESLKFADYIYKDATIYLNRKHNKFNTYILSEKQQLRLIYPKCPDCGGVPQGNGCRNGKKRLVCTQCNRHYDVLLPHM